MPSWHEPLPEPVPDLATVVLKKGETRLDEGDAKKTLERDSLPAFLPNQRWFAGKAAGRPKVSVEEFGALEGTKGRIHLIAAKTEAGGAGARYFVPLTTTNDGGPESTFTVAKLRRVAEVSPLYDALADDSLARAALGAMREETTAGSVHFRKTRALDQAELAQGEEVRRMLAEQSNSSVKLGRTAILKGIRKLSAGVHPEVEVTRFLTEEAGYKNAPALLGWAEAETEEGPTTLIVMSAFVENQGDAWTRFTDSLVRRLETKKVADDESGQPSEDYAPPPVHDPYRTLGTRLGELHAAFRTKTDDLSFAAEKVTQDDIAHWQESAKSFAERAFAAPDKDGIKALHARGGEVTRLIDNLGSLTPSGYKTRIHGDLHLGQVLVAQDDFAIIDFEGEPGRSLEDRRRKTSPLRDVAGMIRSFDYAAAFAARKAIEAGLVDPEQARAESLRWRDEAGHGFLKGYYAAIEAAGVRDTDREAEHALLRFFILEKALYEVAYEADNRPEWLSIPIGGVLRILDGEES